MRPLASLIKQVLPPAVDLGDLLADERAGHETRLDRPGQPRIDDLGVDDRGALEDGRDLAADGFDLGQLGHDGHRRDAGGTVARPTRGGDRWPRSS